MPTRRERFQPAFGSALRVEPELTTTSVAILRIDRRATRRSDPFTGQSKLLRPVVTLSRFLGTFEPASYSKLSRLAICVDLNGAVVPKFESSPSIVT